MSRQVWISVSEGKHWPTPPEPSDEFEKLLWDRRNSLYAAKMAQLLGVRLKVVFGVDACTVTSSQPGAEKLVLSFDASMSPDLAEKIEKDLREFADKEWLRPTAESWDKLRKIPRAPLKWTKGVLDGTKEEEDQRPSEWQKQEQARQDKELEMAMRNQGPKLMSWGDDE
jgi:hypothetical protein